MHKKIDKYEIIEELGHGGQGTVYKAIDPDLGNRVVVIKLIEVPGGKEKSMPVQQALDRFKREVQITAQLNHPQIAQVFDFGLDKENEVAWMARQYLDGEQLSEMIKQHGKFDFETGAEIILSLARVLDHLHAENIVHRDIKPSNIFIQDNVPMLIDFGLSSVEGEQTQITQTQQSMGTPGYMPPELINKATRDEYQRSPSRDWWGLGCVAFEIFAGRPLLEYDESSFIIAALIQAEEQEEIKKSLADNPALPLVKGLLERDPENRCSSMNDLKSIINASVKPQIVEKPQPIIKPQIWENVKDVLTLTGHSDSVLSVVFSPDSKRLASGSGDKTIKIWSVASGREICTLRGHSDTVWSVAFSPDGAKLASGSLDNTIKVWSVSDGSEICTLRGHKDLFNEGVYSVAFSPDSTKLASGSYDATIKIWRIE